MAVGAWYRRALALAGAICALVPALAMWGFTVDDALISLRYAHHIASGAGYRFDAHGPPTDGVTPLPWAPLVVPLTSGADLVSALERVKAVGVVVWTVAGAALGHALSRRAGGERTATIHAGIGLVVVALAFPIGAWAASGMETGAATALATFAAVSFDRPRRAAIFAGLAATFRPELVVWSVTLASGAAIADRGPGRARRAATTAAIAFAPFALCAVVRLTVFGRAAPLAVLAKPSDLAHGVLYAAAASLVVLLPLLAFAPVALRRASPLAKTIATAALVHVLVVVAVGGDWMPYARLLVPVAPSLALVFVDLGRVAHPASTIGRALVAIVLGVVIALRAAPAGRHVHEARKHLIAEARPVLADAKVIAALDIGWVGAATDATIIDLAGLTDPAIAVLPGGHTSKAVDLGMLLDRNVDTIVVYGEPRIVEQRLLRTPLFREKFDAVATLSFGSQRLQRYDVYRRR